MPAVKEPRRQQEQLDACTVDSRILTEPRRIFIKALSHNGSQKRCPAAGSCHLERLYRLHADLGGFTAP